MLRHDMRLALRRARRHFWSIGSVIVAIALAIAINAAFFSVFHGLRFGDLPFEEAERLLSVDYRPVAGRPPELAYAPHLTAERDALRDGLEASLLVAGAAQVGFSSFFRRLDSDGIEATGVDSRFFRVLGLEPALGRVLVPADESSSALLSFDAPEPLPIVLGHALWQDRFGGSAEAIGQVRELGGRPVRIVGVMAVGVKFPGETNVWAPVSPTRQRPPALLRIAAGATQQGLQAAFPQLTFTPLRETIRPGEHQSVTLLFAAATLLVLVTWVQVAMLLWSGAMGRLREVGVQLALGSGTGRIVRQFTVEATLGAAAALCLGWLGAKPLLVFVVGSLPESLRSGQYLDPTLRTYAFAGGLVLAGLLVLMAVPIAVVRRARPWRLLAGSVGNMPAGGLRMRNGFLLVQVTVTCCLLYAAGVVVHSHLRASAFDYGFDSEHVLLFSPPDHTATEAAHESREALQGARSRQEALLTESVDRLNASPFVVAAAQVRAIRLPGVSSVVDEPIVSFNGGPSPSHFDLRTQVSGADATFLRALGTALVAGNGLDDERHAGRHDIAVVNEALARRLAPPVRIMDMELSSNVIGTTIQTPFFEGEIVGIMKDIVDAGPGFPARPQMFVPVSHANYASGMITIRATAPVDASLPVIRSTLAEVWGAAPARRFGLMRDEVDRHLAPYRARSILLGLIAVFSLPLAALGLAGGMLALVRSREQEMAIRIALGADPAGARRWVTAQGLSVVAAALVPGVALGAVLARVVAHQLFEVQPADPASIATVVVVFLGLGWAIGQVAGRRLLRVDRLTALLRT